MLKCGGPDGGPFTCVECYAKNFLCMKDKECCMNKKGTKGGCKDGECNKMCVPKKGMTKKPKKCCSGKLKMSGKCK